MRDWQADPACRKSLTARRFAVSDANPEGVCDNRSQTARKLLILNAERWPSGLRRTLGKRVYGKPYRGFESRSLRQPSLANGELRLAARAGIPVAMPPPSARHRR